MNSLDAFLLFCQGLGAFVGAVSAVWAEISYIRAMRNGHLDRAERVHLKVLGHGLRYGMALLLLSSLGLVITAYLQHAVMQPALTSDYWIVVTFAILIIALTWALSRNRISFALGSVAASTAWWALMYLAYQHASSVSYGDALATYVIATGILYALFFYVRFLLAHPRSATL